MHMHKYYKKENKFFIEAVLPEDADWYAFEETTYTYVYRHT